VILYADRITGSMERAMEETERRREKQIAHNLEHGITPRTVVRGVSDILQGVMEQTAKGRGKSRDKKRERAVAEDQARFEPNNLKATIADLEKRMREAAADLEFEEAARLRDEIKKLEGA
jgi:excinuclease ABC subunit B